MMGDAYLQYLFSMLYNGEKSEAAKLKTARSHGLTLITKIFAYNVTYQEAVCWVVEAEM